MAEGGRESPRKRLRLDKTGNAASLDDQTRLDNQLKKQQQDHAISTATQTDLQRELRSGITAFVNPETQGFSAVFKQRYSDFLVNEILPSGEVLHLLDIEDGRHKRPKKSSDDKSADAKRVRDIDGASAVSIGEAKKEDNATVTTEAATKNPNPETSDQIVGSEQTEKVENGKSTAVELPRLSDEDQTALHDIFGEATTKKIIKLYHNVLKHPDRKRRDFDKVVSPEIDDKDQRTKGHMTVRRIFQSKLDTTTLEDSSIVISAAISSTNVSKKENWKAQRQAGSQFGGGRLGWDELGGQYLHFTLYKENKDTMEIMSFLASQMKLHPRNFTFAGTKDRRGVTVQRVSAYRVQSARLAGLGQHLRNAKIGGFKYEQDPLTLGELNGNEFVIVLRDTHVEGDEGLDLDARISFTNNVIQTAADSLRNEGFINYYGLQRFGTFSTSTDQVGLKLLQNDFKGAVELILSYGPEVLQAANGERPDLSIPSDDRKRAMALETWNASKNAQQVLPLLPRKFSGESNIIKHLGYVRQGKRMQENDFEGALNTLQRPLRLMYVHAYQSLVWNTVAGFRWKKYGNKVIEGDLVLIDSKQVQADDVDEAGEIIIKPQQDDRAVLEEDFVRARPLTATEVASGNHSIEDIVLPLPGFDVVYPANDVGKYYEEFMGSERGGGLNPHDMRRKIKDFSLSGGYRKLLAKPALLECEVKTYTSDTEQLAETDVDRINGTSLETANTENTAQTAPSDLSDSTTRLAVVLKMQLGSSQYASMALREMLKAGGLGTYKAAF